MELHPIAIFPDNYKKVLDNYAVKIGRAKRKAPADFCLQARGDWERNLLTAKIPLPEVPERNELPFPT